MQTFVTGGTGLLGGHLVRQLVEGGHDVKALVRSREKADRLLGGSGAEIVVGDVRDVAGFAQELEGCEALIHTAAYFREYYEPGDHWDRLREVNVAGTTSLLEAADRHGVARVIHVSSSGVVGPGPGGKPGTEKTVLAPQETDNLYFRSKVLAEEAIDDFLATHDLPVVRVLPGWLFGPGDAAPTASGRLILDYLHGDLRGTFEGGGQATDVRDVARAILAAVDRGESGERYIVAGDHTTLPEIAATLEEITTIPAPRTLPYPVVATVARVGALYGRLTGRPVLLTPEGVATLRDGGRVSSAKAGRELGATFRPLEETLRDEVRWYLDHGYVDANVEIDPSRLSHERGASNTTNAVDEHGGIAR